MELTHRPYLHSRGADRSLTALVVLLIADIAFIVPLVQMGWLNRHAHDLALVAVMGLGAFAVWTHLMAARVVAVIACALAVIRVANFWLPDEHLRFWDAAFTLVGCLLLGWLVLRQAIAGHGRMNWHRVQGAVGAYLLAWGAFTQAFRLVAMGFPGAFQVAGVPASYGEVVSQLGYFSMVTIATLGYGDIVPLHPLARSLAMVEAVFGVIYPVILIGWLVTLEVETGRDEASGDGKSKKP